MVVRLSQHCANLGESLRTHQRSYPLRPSDLDHRAGLNWGSPSLSRLTRVNLGLNDFLINESVVLWGIRLIRVNFLNDKIRWEFGKVNLSSLDSKGGPH